MKARWQVLDAPLVFHEAPLASAEVRRWEGVRSLTLKLANVHREMGEALLRIVLEPVQTDRLWWHFEDKAIRAEITAVRWDEYAAIAEVDLDELPGQSEGGA